MPAFCSLVRLWREGQMVLRSALVLCARLFPRPIRTRGDARRGEAGLMHTHSCHDALTLARHATATRASRYPAGCTLMMRQISCHACDMLGDIPFGGLVLAGTPMAACCMTFVWCHGASARRCARAAACTCHMPVYSGAHACTAGCPERTISRGGPVYARNSLLLLSSSSLLLLL